MAESRPGIQKRARRQMARHRNPPPDAPWPEVREHRSCAANVIGITVRHEQSAKPADAARPQGRRNHPGTDVERSAAKRRAAGVHEHGASAGFEQHRLSLPDVEHRESKRWSRLCASDHQEIGAADDRLTFSYQKRET